MTLLKAINALQERLIGAFIVLTPQRIRIGRAPRQ
jgi:hypothetical protein